MAQPILLGCLATAALLQFYTWSDIWLYTKQGVVHGFWILLRFLFLLLLVALVQPLYPTYIYPIARTLYSYGYDFCAPLVHSAQLLLLGLDPTGLYAAYLTPADNIVFSSSNIIHIVNTPPPRSV